jgi:glutathione S-transferase
VNYTDNYLRELGRMSALDVFLAGVAVRIQLTPTDHQLAVDHYEAIHAWIERVGPRSISARANNTPWRTPRKAFAK